jgi:hypothetical protein
MDAFFIPHNPEKGVTCEWLHQGRIGIFTLANASQESLETLQDIQGRWRLWLPPNAPLFCLYDFAQIKSIAPPVWIVGLRMGYAMKNTPGCSALILPDHPISRMIRLLIQQLSLRHDKRQRRFFSDRQTAIEWLETRLWESHA